MALDPTKVGFRINAIREEAGLSLAALAERSGVTKSYLVRLERGEVENPGLATLGAVASALDVTLAQLVEEEQSGLGGSEWERLEPGISESLRTFLLDLKEEDGRPVPTDVKVALAKIQFRGRRPDTPQDWQFLYSAILRSLATRPRTRRGSDEDSSGE